MERTGLRFQEAQTNKMNLYDYTKEKPDYEVEQERWENEGYDV
jgi:hypothetical protein